MLCAVVYENCYAKVILRETPHLANKKNRADLVISLDAFEKLYLDRPIINEYVFLTNDSDFSVIMDILRRYGRRVVLITSKEDSNREIFNNCSDKILLVDDYIETQKTTLPPEKNNDTNLNINDDIAINNLMSVLKALDPDKEYLYSQVGSKFKDIDKSFDIGKTSFKKFNTLAEYFQKEGIINIDSHKNKNDIIITLANVTLDMDWVVDTTLKADVAREMIKGNLSVDEICKNYNVNPEQAIRWAEVVYKSIFGDHESSEEIC